MNIDKTKTSSKLTEATFLDKLGHKIKVADVVTQDECWYVEKEKRWVLSHRAIQKIAAIAGISNNYDVEESPTIQPTYKNELEHIVRVTIKCLTKRRGRGTSGCIHNALENTLTVTGEANKLNTPVRGRGYLRKMAEKRAYDVAVLEHLGLYDTTFSEEESAAITDKSFQSVGTIDISNVELEALNEEINMLVDCDSHDKFNKAIATIEAKKQTRAYNDTQLAFLENLKNDRLITITHIEDNTKEKAF